VRRRIVLLFAAAFVVGVLLWAGSIFGGKIIGAALVDEFSEGTGCFVSLENPRLSFFPPRGYVENVSIRNLSDPEDPGFQVRGISVRLNPLPLFFKHLSLRELRLYGATGEYRNKQDGFYRTMDFLFGPPTPDKKNWHSFITSNWKVRVLDVVILASEKNVSALRIRNDEQILDIENISASIIKSNFGLTPNYDFSLRAQSFTVTLQSTVSTRLGQLAAKGSIAPGLIAFEEVELLRDAAVTTSTSSQTLDAQLLKLSGKLELDEPEDRQLNLNFELNLNDEVLKSLYPEISLPEMKFAATGEVLGAFDDPRIEAAFKMRRAEIEQSPDDVSAECDFNELIAKLVLDKRQLALTEVHLGTLTIEGESKLEFNDEKSINSKLHFVSNNNKDQVELCLEEVSTSEDPQSSAFKRLFQLGLADTDFSVELDGQLTPLSLSLTAKGEVNNSNLKDKIFFGAEAELKNDVLRLQLQESGLYRGIARIEELPTIEEQTQTEFVRSEPAGLELDLRYNIGAESVDIERFVAKHYPLRAVLVRLYPFVSTAALDSLGSIINERSLLDFSFSGEGDLKTHLVKGNGNITLTEMELAEDFVLTPISLNLRADGRNLYINDIVASSEGLSVLGSVAVTDWQNLKGELSISMPDAAEVPLWRNRLGEMKANGSGEFKLTGTVTEPEYTGRVLLESQLPGTKRQLASELNINGDGNLLTLSGSLLGKKATVDLRLPFEDGGKVELAVVANKLPVQYVMAEEVTDETKPISPGQLSGHANYNGTKGALLRGTGEIVIDSISALTSGIALSNKKPILISIGDGKLRFKEFELFADEQRLVIDGFVDQQHGWNARVSGQWELGAFSSIAPVLEQFSGRTEVMLSIEGDVSQPQIKGPLTVHDGSLSLPLGKSVVGVDDLEVEALFNGKDFIISKISGSIGSGELKGSGAVYSLVNEEERRVSFDFVADEIVLEPMDHLSVDMAGDIKIRQSDAKQFTLTANLNITEALYEDKTSVADIARSLTGFLIASRNAPQGGFRSRRRGMADSSKWFLDISLNAPGSLIVDTNVIQAELRSDLKVSGPLNEPKVKGEIEVIDGVFAVGSSQFQIINAQMKFRSNVEQIDPSLNILGETVAAAQTGEDHLIQVAVSGRLSEPNVTFSSDSGLTEREILVMLGGLGGDSSFGSIDLASASREDRDLGELLSMNSDLTIQQRLSGLTGITEVKIVPTLSAETGQFSPKVVATRPLIRDLELNFSSELAERDNNTARIDYELLPHLNLSSGWKSRPLSSEATSGSFDIGFIYGNTFPGVSIFPPAIVGDDEDDE